MYMATTLMLMQTPFNGPLSKRYSEPLTLFWKGFLIECWLTD